MAKDYFTLEALPARYGDCLLLHYGSDQSPGLALIDGGPSKVWGPFLKPRLTALRAKRGAGFKIDMLMVSHIDDDHVLGINDFLAAWKADSTAGRQWPFPVRQAWFNSFERISNAKTLDAVTASVTASTGAASLDEVDLDRPEIANPSRDEARAGLKVLASVRNGKTLRDGLQALNVPTNIGFDGDLVRPGEGPSIPFKLGPTVTLHVVGPLPNELTKLQAKFAKELKPEDALAAYTDESVPNLSSISVLARAGVHSMLLTGDARGDFLLEGLKQEGLLDSAGKLHVDILKMPHHGSDRNVEKAFFAAVTADHYVASADGTFGNPDRATLEMLAGARGKQAQYTVHFTYPLDEIDKRRREEWEKERAVEISKGKPARPAWNAATDDLRTFRDDRRAAGYKFDFAAPASTGQSAKVELMAPIPA
ncbi:MAG TPA: MBL fold metallo-hydrolase [Allosphingosinicella sp.]